MTGIPPYFNKPLFPGLANNQMLDMEQARTLLAQTSVDYQDATKRPVLDAYLQQVMVEEAFVTPRRLVEISAAARQYLGGDPSQLAQQQLVERGQAVDRSKLPPAYAAQIANIPDETIIEAANFERSVRPELTQKQAIDLWIERAQKTVPQGLNVSNVIGMKDTRDGVEQTIRGVSVGNG
jgi:hypothetical protein